jgi:FMN-dependent NADH-azoreductase
VEKIFPLSQEYLNLRDFLIKNRKYNHEIFDYAKQFVEADMILIAAPYWDLSFPEILKLIWKI